MIYLDYNATAPQRPEVIARMQELMHWPLNASSVHTHGRKAKQILTQSRAKIAEYFSVFPHEVIFTASATEANNMALHAFPEREVYVSAVEHSSVWWVNPQNRIKVDDRGLVDLSHLEVILNANSDPKFVSVILVNNETGVVQPINEIAEIVHKYGAIVHVDAVQMVGKMPLDIGLTGADMVTVAAHKCGGPMGVAALIVRGELPIAPLLRGGKQEFGKRAGTENIAAIAGFATALEYVDYAHMQALRGWLDVMESDISKAAPDAIMWGKDAPRLPNTSCISMPNVDQEIQLMDFDLKGLMVSAGSACTSGRIEPSYVLKAMGATDAQAKSSIRVSGGWNTKQEEIERFTEAWKNLYERLSK